MDKSTLYQNQVIKHKNGNLFKVKKDYGGVVSVVDGVQTFVISKLNIAFICQPIY